MKEFSKTDQVIYTTHSTLMIDAYEYQSIGIVRKDSIEVGSKVHNCNTEC
jgi:predicted ATP-dependent endonuclease of OLD family